MKTIRVRSIGLIAAIVVMNPLIAATRGQGIIIDHRSRVPIAHSYEIREVSIDGRVRDQVAEVQVSQTFHNPGSFELETEFLFPLPEEGAIQNFVLMVDGRELPGRLLPRDEAGGSTKTSSGPSATPPCSNTWAADSIAQAFSRFRPARIARSRCATRSFANAIATSSSFRIP